MFENYKDSLFNDEIILKLQQWFKSDCHNVYTQEINKIALNSNNDKRLQTIDKIIYPYRMEQEAKAIYEEAIKININFDNYANENKTKRNLNWPYIPDDPYRILIIGGSGSGKKKALLNLVNNQSDIDKIYLYAKDPYKSKYQFLINKRESIGLKRFNYPKAFIEYSNDMQDIYKNIDKYNIDIT